MEEGSPRMRFIERDFLSEILLLILEFRVDQVLVRLVEYSSDLANYVQILVRVVHGCTGRLIWQ
jgi:hypothetical protein